MVYPMPKRKPDTNVVSSPDVEPPEAYPGQRPFEGAVDAILANATPPDPLKRKLRKKARRSR